MNVNTKAYDSLSWELCNTLTFHSQKENIRICEVEQSQNTVDMMDGWQLMSMEIKYDATQLLVFSSHCGYLLWIFLKIGSVINSALHN